MSEKMSSYLQPRISSTTNVSELGYLSIWPKPSLTKIIPPPPQVNHHIPPNLVAPRPQSTQLIHVHFSPCPTHG